MKLALFGLYDKVGKVYSNPNTLLYVPGVDKTPGQSSWERTLAYAKRYYGEIFLDSPHSTQALSPESFVVVCYGKFDSDDGCITSPEVNKPMPHPVIAFELADVKPDGKE